MGRVAPENAVPWLTIHDRTKYADVVFSPDIEGVPFSMYAAIAGKVVYRIDSFAKIDLRLQPCLRTLQCHRRAKGTGRQRDFRRSNRRSSRA
jgi:hypothetical protein